MANILIAPLGVGPIDSKKVRKREYRKAHYAFYGEKEQFETSFASAFLVKKLNIDKVFFIGTAHSLWEEVYRYFTFKGGQEEDSEYWAGLASKVYSSNHAVENLAPQDLIQTNKAVDLYLKKANLQATGGTKSFIISYGLEEKEIWANTDVFWEIEESFQDGDNIFLDITHSFRSIPLFMYLMTDFTLMLSNKDVKLQGIYYGMLDVSGELGYAPVVNLGSLFTISNWIKGVYDFVNYGNGYLIADLMEEEISDDSICENIRTISDLVNMNCLPDLRKNIKKFKQNLRQGKLSSVKMFKYIQPKFEEFLKHFSNLENDFQFQLDMAVWYFKNKKYAIGYICLTEAILTGLCEVFKYEANYDNREEMKKFLYNGDKECRKFNLDAFYGKIAGAYRPINEIRKLSAHSSLDSENVSYQKYINEALENCEKVRNLFKSEDMERLARYINVELIKSSK
jgi:CRISPR-associated Csx2 family protein